jgi:hypothetical protein
MSLERRICCVNHFGPDIGVYPFAGEFWPLDPVA